MKDICKEEWRDINGYDPKYEVSNLGRVRRKTKSFSYTYMNGVLNKKNGYLYVSLVKNKKWKPVPIHRIVALAFLSNIENKKEIDHINTIRTDNRACNLRWVTRKENANNPLTKQKLSITFTGTKSPHFGRKRTKETCQKISEALKGLPKKKGSDSCFAISVHQYDEQGNYIRTFGSIKDASKENGIPDSNICKVCLGKRKTAGGFIWRYAE